MATLHRFFVTGPINAGELALPPEVARQVSTVLRMRPDEQITLFDGAGGEWLATITSLGRTAATVWVSKWRNPETEPALRLTLCQALLKADKMDWVLQKGTELGVMEFQPLLSERVVPLRGSGGATDRLDRWRRIVTEAAEQSGRTVVPKVSAPIALGQALAQGMSAIFLWEEEQSHPFREALAAVTQVDAPGDLRIFIGPEGGFSKGEASDAVAAGARVATLGKRILRSETAAVAACSLALINR